MLPSHNDKRIKVLADGAQSDEFEDFNLTLRVCTRNVMEIVENLYVQEVSQL